MSLTHKQKQFFDYIQTFMDKHKAPPSCTQLQNHFGFASKSSVYRHLRLLKDKGLIQLNRSKAPYISLIKKEKKSAELYQLPILGSLNDFGEIEASEESKEVLYSCSKKIPKNCYALLVNTGNYLEAGLLHHDILIIEPRSEARTSETIIGFVYQERYVIKKYQPKGPYVRLDSFCLQIEPMIISSEELDIQGIVLSVIRQY